jgi:hypothetical protein
MPIKAAWLIYAKLFHRQKNLVAISQVELKVHSSCHETTQQASTAPATRFQSHKHNLMKLISIISRISG